MIEMRFLKPLTFNQRTEQKVTQNLALRAAGFVLFQATKCKSVLPKALHLQSLQFVGPKVSLMNERRKTSLIGSELPVYLPIHSDQF